LKTEEHLEDLCTDVREILQLIYKKQNWVAQTELIRVSIETRGGQLWRL